MLGWGGGLSVQSEHARFPACLVLRFLAIERTTHIAASAGKSTIQQNLMTIHGFTTGPATALPNFSHESSEVTFAAAVGQFENERICRGDIIGVMQCDAFFEMLDGVAIHGYVFCLV